MWGYLLITKNDYKTNIGKMKYMVVMSQIIVSNKIYEVSVSVLFFLHLRAKKLNRRLL
jgi:hypothetical protein